MSAPVRKSEKNPIPKDWQRSVVSILSTYANEPTARMYYRNVDSIIFPTKEDLFDSLIAFFLNSSKAKRERVYPRNPNMTTFSFHFDSFVSPKLSGQVPVRKVYGKVGYDPSSHSVSIWSAHPDSFTRPSFFFQNWNSP